ncbi:carboxylesterase 1D-like isoform X1 [Styela clava]
MSSTVVSTTNGMVKGKVVNLDEKGGIPVHIFRNIPFAKPPLGELRFMPPQPAEPWDGIRDGTTSGNLPMYAKEFDQIMMKNWLFMNQNDVVSKHDEDCLHLSVYTPSTSRGQNLAVMFWIYGGAFSMGSERFYDGTVLAGMNNVVVVVPNYRVGIFGFLSLGPSSACPGNAGLLDQQMALKWIQGNIENFGGDQNNVTIFGESAGGVSVNIHILSPLSHGLFHKAISHSGQATAKAIVHSEAEHAETNKKVLSYLKIEQMDADKTLQALQNTSAEELINASMQFTGHEAYPFVPTEYGNVLPKTPEQFMEDKDFPKLPYIIGFNNTEGDGLLTAMLCSKYSEGLTEDESRNAMRVTMTDDGYKKCKEFYINDSEDKMRFSKLFGKVSADELFATNAIQTASSYSSAGVPVYMYYGTFRLKMFHETRYGPEVPKKVDWCVCDHGDDIFMTFGMPFSSNPMSFGAKFSEEEKEISRKFMTYLTNFAKTGNPNEGNKVGTKWPLYGQNKEHLIVDSSFTVGGNFYEKEVEFWMNTMPRYIIKH